MQTVALKFTLQILFLGSSGQMTAGRFHGLLDVGAGDASKTKNELSVNADLYQMMHFNMTVIPTTAPFN